MKLPVDLTREQQLTFYGGRTFSSNMVTVRTVLILNDKVAFLAEYNTGSAALAISSPPRLRVCCREFGQL